MSKFKVGDRVKHDSAGDGIITKIEDTNIHIKLNSGKEGIIAPRVWVTSDFHLTLLPPAKPEFKEGRIYKAHSGFKYIAVYINGRFEVMSCSILWNSWAVVGWNAKNENYTIDQEYAPGATIDHYEFKNPKYFPEEPKEKITIPKDYFTDMKFEVITTPTGPNWFYQEFANQFNQEPKGSLIKKTMSNIMEFAKNLTLSADEKLLRKYGLHDENGNRTSSAEDLIEEKMFSDNEPYLLEIARAKEAEDAKK
jgi:hypothetical protein